MKNRILFLCFFVLGIVPGLLSQTKKITVDDIWEKYLFYPRSVYGFNPMQNSEHYTVVSLMGIEKYSFETGEKEEEILTNRDLMQLSSNQLNIRKIDDYVIDHSGEKILLATGTEPIYRRSTRAFYYVYDRKQNTIRLLSDTLLGKQSFATFSPDGSKVAFVRANNLFVKDLASGNEIPITNDGLENHIINGAADWVYEEELSLAKAFEWSPDSRKIAFMRFDESRVKEFSMTYFGELYPVEYKFKYPKAGEDNSLVNILIYDLQSGNKTALDMGDNDNCYFPRIYWLPDAKELMVLKLNRHQNKLDFYRYNTGNGTLEIVYTDENKCWVEVNDTYYFLDDNRSMLLTSERDGYNHIYKVEFGGPVTQLTQGNWEVNDISAVDPKKKLIYYLSNESSPLNRDLYVIGFDGRKKKMLTNGSGWNSVRFSPNSGYYMDTYSDRNTPPVVSIYRNDGKLLRVLEDNEQLKKTITDYGFSKKELFSFMTYDGTNLNGWMIKPTDFDYRKKYPVLMYVYGGPGSQEVNNAWFRSQDVAWYQMLAQHGYIVVCVDGFGTAGRGDAFKKAIYKQMGNLESESQIDAALYLRSLPYVDPERIGIWGWSFGGYLSSLAMFKGDGLFKTAIAVAPVTNWRYYDNIYTERFLQTPQENPSGYDENSPIFHAGKLKGNYLLIHGMTDDNVHFQNAVDLTTALIKANKQFDHFFYPNMNHFINDGNARQHLYTLLTQYILENL